MTSDESGEMGPEAANHTGVRTPRPFFRNVSRQRYFCPLNWRSPEEDICVLCLFPGFASPNHNQPKKWRAGAQFFGKFGSALTSRICKVCRRVWPEMSRIH